MSGVSMVVPNEQLDWLNDGPTFQVDVLGEKTTAIVDPSAPIVLLSKRPMQHLPDGSIEFYNDPSPGLMVWLSPK